MAGWTPVKVALLSDCYPPRVGGIERQVHDLAHRLAQAGHAVEVFTATTGPEGERSGERTIRLRGVSSAVSCSVPSKESSRLAKSLVGSGGRAMTGRKLGLLPP